MKHRLQDDRELYLNKDYKKWDNVSKKYGKERLLLLFENGFKDIKKGEDPKYIFKNKIIGHLKKEKGQNYIKEKTFKSLIYLFGKFQFFYEKNIKLISDSLSQGIEKGKNLQDNTKKEIKDIFKKTQMVSREEQINPWEKQYMQINLFGDIVAPGDTKNFEIENQYMENPEILEQKENFIKKNKDNQLEIPFDNV